jgi:hypothetical protein
VKLLGSLVEVAANLTGPLQGFGCTLVESCKKRAEKEQQQPEQEREGIKQTLSASIRNRSQ